MSLSSNRMRQSPNGKRSHGRGNGRGNGNGRSHRNGNNGQVNRGNARQVMEKYLNMAKDAVAAGDTVAAEGYFQHAEHYFRVMSSNGQDPDARERRPRSQPPKAEDQPQPQLAGNEPAPQE